MAAYQERMSRMFEPGSSHSASFFAPAGLLIHASRSHEAFARIEPHQVPEGGFTCFALVFSQCPSLGS